MNRALSVSELSWARIWASVMSGFSATGTCFVVADRSRVLTLLPSFMKNVYTVFSFDDETVGFAALA